MFKIKWSVSNNAFCVFFGETLTDIDGKRFFQNKKEVNNFLKLHGLKLQNNNIVKAWFKHFSSIPEKNRNAL